MRQHLYTMFITTIHASFHLWWKEHLVKYQKVSKYYDHSCSKLFLLNISFCMFLDESIILICYGVLFLIAGLNKQQQKDMMYWVIQYENGMIWLFVNFSLKFHDYIGNFRVWLFLFSFLLLFAMLQNSFKYSGTRFVEILSIKKYFYRHYDCNTNNEKKTKLTISIIRIHLDVHIQWLRPASISVLLCHVICHLPINEQFPHHV